MSMSQLVAVRYVGKKRTAHDNVARSRKMWHGNGDIQEVTPMQAKLLCRHPDQWELVSDADAARVQEVVTVEVKDDTDGTFAQIDPAELSKPLEKMTKPELKAYAAEKFGLALDIRRSTKFLIDEIQNAQENGAD